jgi:hypothetical protein
MLESCHKHPHEMGAAFCGRCGQSWCADCLVYSFGPKKPPYCVSCAMVAAGVRSTAALPAMPRKQLKAQMKALKAEAKAAAKAETSSAPVPAAAETEPAAAPTTDWATPWWEDHQEPALAD